MRVLRVAVIAAVAVGLAGAGTSGPARGGDEAAAPKPPCVRAADRARVLRFRAADRTRLLGITMGRGPNGVVLAHHWRGSLCSWMPYARTLKARGFRVLAFDFRGHGLSGYPPHPRAEHLDRDVRAAVRVLRSLGATRVALAGESMGGTAVLHMAASLQHAPVAVVSLSAPTVFGRLNGTKALASLRLPVLLVAAENDDGFADEARALNAASGSPETTKLEIVPGGAHGADMLRAAAVRDLVTTFLEQARGQRLAAAPPYRNPTAGAVLALQIRGMHRAQVRRTSSTRAQAARRSGWTSTGRAVRPRRDACRRCCSAARRRSGPSASRGRSRLGAAHRGLRPGGGDVRHPVERPTRPVRGRRRGDRLRPRPCCDARGRRQPALHAGVLDRNGALASLGDDARVAAVRPLQRRLLRPARRLTPALGVAPQLAEEFSAITYLRRDGARIAPMLVAKAGREQFEGINESIDAFIAEAARVGAPVRLETHPTGGHGFDVATPNRRTREIIRATLAFFRARLLSST